MTIAQDIAKQAAVIIAGALSAAIVRIIEGATLDDALATAAEHIADERTRARFPNYRPGA